MVEEHEPPDIGPLGELDGVRDARVPPADPGGVLGLTELAVVEEDVLGAIMKLKDKSGAQMRNG